MKKLAVVVAVLLLAAACGSDSDESSGDPEAALNAYADGINANSVDQTMEAFAEDAVMVEHPLNPGELNGTEEVSRGVSDTVIRSREDPDAYLVSAVEVDGETVSWSYLWINVDNNEYCAVGNEIDVNDDGLIVELRWGQDPGGEQCEAVKAAA
jgi:hypothetical protein